MRSMTDATTLRLTVRGAHGGSQTAEVAVERLVVAGYTGRDRAKVMEHVRELAALGVPAPERVPALYPLSPELLTTGQRVTVGGARTSGEAECILVGTHDGLLVGVGSDHTDRELEREDVLRSKAVCPKPVGGAVWRYEEVAAHWDMLELRSWATDASGRRAYQLGSVAALLSVEALLREVTGSAEPTPGLFIYGGTLPLLGEFVMGDRFEAELHDPVLERTLRCAYEVTVG